MRAARKAFTYVEAVLSILIFGILAAIILPHFVKEGFLGSLSLRAATTEITSDIRYTRQLAITNTGHYLIKFDFSAKEYKIYKDSIAPQNQTGQTKQISSQINCSGTDQFDFYSLGNCTFLGTGLLLSQGTSQNRVSAETTTGVVVVEKVS